MLCLVTIIGLFISFIDIIVYNVIMSTSTAIKQKTLSEQIYQQIKEDIISGKIPQGQKIGETELAKAYGISRGPLREALHQLEYINLVERTPHAGSRIVTLDYQMMLEVYQVREAMEGMAVRLSTINMSQAEIDDLYSLLDRHDKSIKQAEGKIYFQKEGDLDFHYYIFSKCQNKWLIDYLNNKLYQILRMCRHRTSQIPLRPEVALREHQNIVDAINNRDAELSEMLIRRHIQGAWKTMKNMLESTNVI